MRAALTVVTFLLAGSAASPAVAALPTTKGGTTIVPGVFIGKAKLGQTKAQGDKAWGSKGSCGPPDGVLTRCLFADRNQRLGRGQLDIVDGRVIQMWLTLYVDPDTNQPARGVTPLKRFRTNKGIGLGSTSQRLLKAYPKGQRSENGSALVALTVKGSGKTTTTFTVQAGIVTVVKLDDGVTAG